MLSPTHYSMIKFCANFTFLSHRPLTDNVELIIGAENLKVTKTCGRNG